jgi:hypothetical protein
VSLGVVTIGTSTISVSITVSNLRSAASRRDGEEHRRLGTIKQTNRQGTVLRAVERAKPRRNQGDDNDELSDAGAVAKALALRRGTVPQTLTRASPRLLSAPPPTPPPPDASRSRSFPLCSVDSLLPPTDSRCRFPQRLPPPFAIAARANKGGGEVKGDWASLLA